MKREIEIMKFEFWLRIAAYHKWMMSMYSTKSSNFLDPDKDPKQKFKKYVRAFLYHEEKLLKAFAKLEVIKERI